MLLNLCASNQNTCFVVRCRVGGGVNSCGKLEKYSNNNVDTVFGTGTGTGTVFFLVFGFWSKYKKIYSCKGKLNEKNSCTPINPQ